MKESLAANNNGNMTREGGLRIVEKRMCEVENAMSQLAEELRALRNRRNTFQIVSRLPPELMQEIFLYLSQDKKLPPLYFPKRSLNYFQCIEPEWDWLTVTWVCQHWRSVAMNSPRLWTTIVNLSCFEMTKVFLERSRELDLSIHFGPLRTWLDLHTEHSVDIGSVYACTTSFRLIADHLERITELSLVTESSSDSWKKLEGFLLTLTSFVRLRRLEIYKKNFVLFACSIRAPEHGKAMQLDHLYLRKNAIPWDYYLLHGLSELTLEDIHVAEQPNLFELLTILDHCKNLQILKLIDSGPIGHEDSAFVVKLDLLQFINVGPIDVDMCKALFTSIYYPDATAWDVTISEYPFEGDTNLYVPSFLDVEEKHEHMTIRLTDDKLTFETFAQDKVFRLSLQLEYEEIMSGDALLCVNSILSSNFWQQTMKITFDIALGLTAWNTDTFRVDFMGKPYWKRFFEHIWDFQDLTLKFTPHYPLEKSCLNALSEFFSSPAHGLRFVCHDLEVLTVVSAIFRGESDWCEIFTNNLKLRSEQGRRLKKLSFIGCTGIDEEKINHLRSLDVCDEIIVFGSWPST